MGLDPIYGLFIAYLCYGPDNMLVSSEKSLGEGE